MKFDVEPYKGYEEPYGLLCAILDDGTRDWRSQMDPNLGADAMVWQPHPGMHSIGGCILHVAAIEIRGFERIALGTATDPEERKMLMVDETDIDGINWPKPHHEPLSWYFDLHDRIRARTLESVKKWGPPTTSMKNGDREITLRWVFGHIIQHEAYHGGQALLLQELWKRL
ncbi:MAG TPA: DinB family protein [Fimbriimonadaceae bacterium]|nr:DinB family protein [Fimbriimonadaceae bacterium]